MHEPIQLDRFLKPVIPMKRRARKKRAFDAAPPFTSGHVLRLFPFARRYSLVEATAERLATCESRKARQALWDLVVKSLEEEIRSFEGDDGEIVRQLCPFHRAVEEAIHERKFKRHPWAPAD